MSFFVPFFRAKGKGMRIFTNWEIREKGLDYVIDYLQQTLKDLPVFISFDIDFLDVAYAPGTGNA